MIATRRPTLYRRAGKRAFDLAASLPLVILTGPLMMVIAAAALIAQGRPVFYRQIRPGLAYLDFTWDTVPPLVALDRVVLVRNPSA